MADTTSNEGRTIATKGSSHTAVQIAPDMCFVPGNPVPQPFGNTVPSTRLLGGQTTKTLIGAQPIVTSIGEMGPLSDPGHAGVLGGVFSGTYRYEAQAITYSKDVYAEGNPVVRALDFTTHNHKNTIGLILPSYHKTEIQTISEEGKKKCTLTKIEATDSDGRPLGYPGKKKPGEEPTYLEVLAYDVVKFKSHRYDITKSPNERNPPCVAGKHTEWTAKTVKKMSGSPATKGPEVTEEFVVKASFAYDFPLSLSAKGSAVDRESDDQEMETSNERDEPDWDAIKREKAPGGSPKSQKRRAAINREREKYRKETGYGRDVPAAQERDLKLAVNAYDFILYLMLRSNPPTIDVEALACGGPKTAQLKVFPSQKFTLEIDLSAPEKKEGDKYFSAIRTACNVLKKVFYVAEKIASFAGEKLAIKFMHGFKIAAEVKYEKCEEEKKSGWGSDYYTPSRVGWGAELALHSTPLIGANGKFNISLLNFVIPCMGQTVGQALRRFKIVRADLFFSVAIGCNISVSIGKDHYDYWTKTGSKFGIACTLAMGLVLGTAGIDIIEFKASFPARFSVGAYAGDRPGVWLQLAPEGQIRADFSIVLFPDRWYEIEAYSASPKMLQFNYQPKRIDALVLPS